MKYISKLTLISLGCLLFAACNKPSSTETRIGIIVPLEHTAMTEIVNGFKKTLAEKYSGPVTIDVENAEADANLERAIIQKMRDGHYTMVVPIGVDATEMSVAMIHDTPIVSLASDFSDKERHQLHPCDIAVVHDEISTDQLLRFIHATFPKLKNLTLVHSSANKVFPEVKETIAVGEKYGIAIHPMMVSSLAEMYSIGQSIPNNTQGIFILKDSLVASGIGTLAQIANKQHIPLISSDEGSVQNGAGFALGVHEQQIGEEGAKLAVDILKNKSACDLPIIAMQKLTVFINPNALQQSGQNVRVIKQAAAQFHYPTENRDKLS